VTILKCTGRSWDGSYILALREIDQHGFLNHVLTLWADKIEVLTVTGQKHVVTLFMRDKVIAILLVDAVEGFLPDDERVKFIVRSGGAA